MTLRYMPFIYQQVGKTNIAYLKMVNILVALKVWHKQWEGLRILINYDNQLVPAVPNNGRSSDNVMGKPLKVQTCLCFRSC